MTQIKFGTDGWRAIIAKDYTVDNVKRVAEATAKWMINRKMSKVVIGHDCRFGGKMFSETAACVFGHFGIKVLLAKEYVSTPMVSLGIVKKQADMGVVITASHNPPSYNGYKLKSAFGGPTIPSDISEVEAIIPQNSLQIIPSIESLKDDGLLEYINLEDLYYDHVMSNFDMEAIRSSGRKIVYDAMYGAGQNIMRRLFPEAILLHCDEDPSFKGTAPEPILRNLGELQETIKSLDNVYCGIANDGDADRIGMFDADGKFVDSHHILLLLLLYMYEHKKMSGKVVVTFSVTDKMEKLAKQYGLDFEVTKIGFKYIAEIMTHEEVLVGGEESGGLAVSGHIPERDGVWIALIVLEFMAKTGKSLTQLIQDIYQKVGAFYFDRNDLHITENLKRDIVKKCSENTYTKFGQFNIVRVETIDGFKFWLSDDQWVLIRPSGTEPVLRVYAQAENKNRVLEILEATKSEILS